VQPHIVSPRLGAGAGAGRTGDVAGGGHGAAGAPAAEPRRHQPFRRAARRLHALRSALDMSLPADLYERLFAGLHHVRCIPDPGTSPLAAGHVGPLSYNMRDCDGPGHMGPRHADPDSVAMVYAALDETEALVQLLGPLVRMVRVSPRLAVALGQAGLPALLVRLLHAPTALTALPLLQLLRSVYEHHPRPKVGFPPNTCMRLHQLALARPHSISVQPAMRRWFVRCAP